MLKRLMFVVLTISLGAYAGNVSQKGV